MKKIIKKHPLAIRWNHWINFPVLFVMIWSGLLIYWANDVYKIRLGGSVLFRFFPDPFYKALGLSYRLAEGMAFHFVFMWIFFLNGLAYVLYTAISGEWRLLVPDRHSFKGAWEVMLHDLHLRKTPPPAPVKYNDAQKIAYTAIIVMGLGSLLTGLAIYKPVQLYWLCALFGGYETARIIHFLLTLGYCLFFIIHIVQVIIAGWNNFRGMVAGFEVIRENDPPLVLHTTGPQPDSLNEIHPISPEPPSPQPENLQSHFGDAYPTDPSKNLDPQDQNPDQENNHHE
jgi:thiosulfate reductase cytochrome b subunit